MRVRLLLGDSLTKLQSFPENSVDSVVCDPPYGLSFMGKRWDYDVPSVEIWQQVLRVLKPGGHLLAFAGTRTQHRMAVNIEDAGFEIRDMIAWVYGSGFPKSLDVSKAIDKAAGAERKVIGQQMLSSGTLNAVKGFGGGATTANGKREPAKIISITAPATDAAHQWQGWGTTLKPALEPITVARKPLVGTVAANVLAHGTGAINVDGCRVETDDNLNGGFYRDSPDEYQAVCYGKHKRGGEFVQPSGRWPANLIHDGSDDVTGLFPQAGGGFGGSAARFFYCAKAGKKERGNGNNHPTVKPIALMRYLCRLVTPPDGLILDPFMGSGSTGVACVYEGFRFLGIELQREYFETSKRRILEAKAKK